MQEAGASHNLGVPWSLCTWGYCLPSGSSLRPASEMADHTLSLSWSRLAYREETNPAIPSMQPNSAPVLAAAVTRPREAPTWSGSTLRAVHWVAREAPWLQLMPPEMMLQVAHSFSRKPAGLGGSPLAQWHLTDCHLLRLLLDQWMIEDAGDSEADGDNRSVQAPALSSPPPSAPSNSS